MTPYFFSDMENEAWWTNEKDGLIFKDRHLLKEEQDYIIDLLPTSKIHPCTPSAERIDFIIKQLNDIKSMYCPWDSRTTYESFYAIDVDSCFRELHPNMEEKHLCSVYEYVVTPSFKETTAVIYGKFQRMTILL